LKDLIEGDESSSLAWELLGSRYEDAGLILFDKRIDSLRNPRNQKEFDRLILESVDWVNIVALDAESRSVMIRQYRFGVGYVTLETPGGMVDEGEDSKVAAIRELKEETGYKSDQWSYLGCVEPNPAFHNHLCHHWLAENAYLDEEQSLGDGEMISIELMNEEQVRESVLSGELKHALALSALSRVFQIWPLPYRQPFNRE
jgi:8-oxo-dGTP pyrophosphatase MutT (NUDIX family)